MYLWCPPLLLQYSSAYICPWCPPPLHNEYIGGCCWWGLQEKPNSNPGWGICDQVSFPLLIQGTRACSQAADSLAIDASRRALLMYQCESPSACLLWPLLSANPWTFCLKAPSLNGGWKSQLCDRAPEQLEKVSYNRMGVEKAVTASGNPEQE